jgi:hypothetical protein
VRVRRTKKPESEKDPKARLNGLFKKHGGQVRDYSDFVHAIKVVKCLTDLKRLAQVTELRNKNGPGVIAKAVFLQKS